MDVNKAKKIHMIGIKGVGMTMLAQFLAAQGKEITGSDTKEIFMTDKVLAAAGIKIKEGFAPENIPVPVDLVIYSTAYNPAHNSELAESFAKKLPLLSYAEALGQIFNQKYGIAVAGSHGKTTTTAWLGYVLNKSGLSPSVMVGANVPQFDGTSLIGQSDYLAIEADEYQNKLKYFQPRIVLLNNIDYDHPDYFPTADDYKNVFVEFIKRIPRQGMLVANFDDPVIRKIASVNTRAKVLGYAIDEQADYVAYDLKAVNGEQFFKVKLAAGDEDSDEEILADTELGDFMIKLPGRHNILNALAVIVTAVELNIELYKIRQYLSEFTGTERRLEEIGEFRGAVIIDDYAHHPTEIKASLDALRQKYPGRHLTVVFHPHTFTRTKALLDDFGGSFTQADALILLDIYGSAREKQGGISSLDLKNKIMEATAGKLPVEYLPELDQAEKFLREQAERDDVIVLMGAGDVFRIGHNLIK